MEGKVLAVAVAMGLILFCASRVSAQEILNLKSGSFYKWNAQSIERELGVPRLEVLTVTLLPRSDSGMLFFDGHPLSAGKPLTREEIGRVWVFTAAQAGAVPVGITVLPDPPLETGPKIRCINPKFSPIISICQSIKKEE